MIRLTELWRFKVYNEEKIIKAVSVVDKWKRAVAKVKADKADANEANFPEKIIGQYWLK